MTASADSREPLGLEPPWGRYDNRELIPPFGVSEYESLLVKLAEIGVRPTATISQMGRAKR